MGIYWIIGGMFVLPGVVLGVYEAVRQVFGYSNAWLFGDVDHSKKFGLLPTVMVQTTILSVFSPMITLLEWESSKLGAIAFTILLSFWQMSIREIPDKTKRQLAIVGHGMLLGAIAGMIAKSLSGGLIGGIIGSLIAGLELLTVERLRKREPQKNYHLFPLWMNILIYCQLLSVSTSKEPFPSDVEILAVYLPVLFIFISWSSVMMGHYLIPPLISFIRGAIRFSLSTVLIALKYKTTLCEHCFRYTHPLKSTYRVGRRYCEHCRQNVENTDTAKKFVVMFGQCVLTFPEQTFLFVNPDFENKVQPVDVSEVYIDPHTCDRRLLERFITYLQLYPPERGVQLVKFFYQGDWQLLGANLGNVLRNNFTQISQIPRKLQGNEQRTGLPHSRLFQTYPKAHPHSRKFFSVPQNKRLILWGVWGGIVGALWGICSLIPFTPYFKFALLEVPRVILGIFTISWWGCALLVGVTEGFKGNRIPRWMLYSFPCFVVLAIEMPEIMWMISRKDVQNRIQTVEEIQSIGTAIGSYSVDHNDCFPNWQGQEILMTSPEFQKGLPVAYYEGAQRDAWERPFMYVSDGMSYTLTSYGKDGKPGAGRNEFDSDIIYRNGRFISPAALVE